jgi:hypothetical protein
LVSLNFAGLLVVFREFLEIGLFYFIIKGSLVKNQAPPKLYRNLNYGLLTASLAGVLFFAVFNYFNLVSKTNLVVFEGVVALSSALLLSYFLYEALSSKELLLHPKNIYITMFVLTIREIVEISFFAKIGNYSIATILIPLFAAFLFFTFGSKLFKMRKMMRFLNIILIIQVGYLFGYAIHEFIALLPSDSIFKVKLYNLDGTIFSKSTLFGSLLNVLFGFTPSPEIIQFIGQYSVTSYFLYRLYKYQFTFNIRYVNE